MSAKTAKTTRKDWRREATRQALIEAAESLFGRYGIDSVSLRQIGTAIDSANANVVGYHFGTKEDVVRAIFDHRLPWLDERRGELYRAARVEKSPLGVRELLRAMWQPLLEQTDKDGAHSLAGFLAELVRTGRGHMLSAIKDSYPNTYVILSEIFAQLPPGIEPLLDFRSGTSLMIVTGQLRFMDNMEPAERESALTAEEYFADAIRMAEAAVTAPIA